MKSMKRIVRKSTSSGQRVLRTTLGELIAAMVDTVGIEQTQGLLTTRSPLQKVLRQRVVIG